MQKETTTKRPVNREAVRVLAQVIGARAAARSLGINEKTVLSWSHRGKWKLPLRRNVGRPALRSQISPSDALAAFKRQGGLTRMDIAMAYAEAAEKLCGQFVAKKHGSVSHSSQSPAVTLKQDPEKVTTDTKTALEEAPAKK